VRHPGSNGLDLPFDERAPDEILLAAGSAAMGGVHREPRFEGYPENEEPVGASRSQPELRRSALCAGSTVAIGFELVGESPHE